MLLELMLMLTFPWSDVGLGIAVEWIEVLVAALV